MTTTTSAPTKPTYRELGLLAEGGMALVTRAVRDDGLDVVVKRVRPPLCFDAAFVRLFHDEGVLCARFDHDNIVRLVDKGEDEQGPYLVFEHVDGVDFGVLLEAARESGTALDVDLVVAVAVPLLRALRCVHSACERSDDNGDDVDSTDSLDVVHRDISPANVLLALDGSVKLADFGVAASRLKTDRTVAGELKGKFAYMAPEQTRGETVTSAADMFSVGVVLYEALANARVFDAATDADVVQQVRHREVAPLSDPRIDVALRELVTQLLDKDPTKRPTAAQALAVLDDVVANRCLDDGLARHVARAVRLAPRKDLGAINPDVPRRHTQRVLGGLAGADTVVRKPVLARRWPLFAGSAVVVVVAVIALASSSPPNEVVVDLPSEPVVAASSEPPPMSIEPDTLHVPPPTTIGATVEATKPAAPTKPTSKPTTSKPATTSKPIPAPVVDGIGRLSVTSEPWARVSVDGVVVAKETPLKAYSLPAGRHTITLENPVLKLKKSIVVDVEKDAHARRFVDLAAP